MFQMALTQQLVPFSRAKPHSKTSNPSRYESLDENDSTCQENDLHSLITRERALKYHPARQGYTFQGPKSRNIPKTLPSAPSGSLSLSLVQCQRLGIVWHSSCHSRRRPPALRFSSRLPRVPDPIRVKTFLTYTTHAHDLDLDHFSPFSTPLPLRPHTNISVRHSSHAPADFPSFSLTCGVESKSAPSPQGSTMSLCLLLS